MRNFDYLKEWDNLVDLYNYCNAAEVTQVKDPDKSALNSRRALEWLVRAIYEMKGIEVDKDNRRASLFELVDGEPFVEFVGDDMLMKAVHYIRKAGNRAAHLGAATRREAFFSLLNLYNFVGAVLVKLQVIENFPEFDRTLIPSYAPMHVVAAPQPQPDKAFVESVDVSKIADAPVERRATGISEAETRRYFVDMMLREAGWEVATTNGAIAPSKACVEVAVEGMPNGSGRGYADYVLFGADCRPLAVIEAKSTSRSATEGRHQAALYADCLERRYGVRPVIYCTNGYRTEVVDGLGYPARTVYGYHTAGELELLIQRRGRSAITNLSVNDEITNREYQKRAVRMVCERFNGNFRRMLLAMATGTGKTRVAISITDVLIRNNWVKNVLFLADRTALVKQAANSFKKLLPAATTCILSEDDKPDMTARVMFSTYQTMINYIDGDTKEFSIGRFDLVIVDEAHRSVFGKYTSILDYFDALLVGLTATPRDDMDRSTFDLFGVDAAQTFFYEYGEAVKDGYLVPYKPLKCGTLILQSGIVYDRLSDEEKEQMESVWRYEKARKALDEKGDYSRDIDNAEIFRYIFNKDTVDKVLQHTMRFGLRVQSGECIGKTIIFACNHRHAEMIVERFNALYPEYGADFCALIDNYVKCAQDLIDKFGFRDKLPQIAVSVDMLDTGIDVPDVLNLVFFKPVRSKIKFMQMIGRGTRLSEDIFGVGKHKEHFTIFDWCDNFGYFGINSDGRESVPAPSLTERLFGVRLDIAVELQRPEFVQDGFAVSLRDRIKTELRGQVAELNDARIDVRAKLATVDKFRRTENWTYVSPVDAVELKEAVAPLLARHAGDEMAKKFDLQMLNIELSQVAAGIDSSRSKRNVVRIARELRERTSHPSIAAKTAVIDEVLSPDFWRDTSLGDLERVRAELRDIVGLIAGGGNRTFTVDIEDTLEESTDAEPFVPKMTYRQSVMEYLAQNRDLPAIRKIMNIEQLDGGDILELERILWKELGSKEDYRRYIADGRMMCGDSVAVFIRSIVGIDRKVAVRRFADFLSGHVLNSEQEEYLKTIIDYVCLNGDITLDDIIGKSPFDSFDWSETFGEYVGCVRDYVNVLHGSIIPHDAA